MNDMWNRWLETRRKDDNAESLWRVHDGLYDLKDFIKYHPGGADWIRLTEVNFNDKIHVYYNCNLLLFTFVTCLFWLQGTDITEAFHVHHVNHGKVESILQEYRVRDAKLPRNFKFTFKETGFYQTIRRRVADKLKTISTKRGEFMTKVRPSISISI